MAILAAAVTRLLKVSSRFADPINLKVALARQNWTPTSRSASTIRIPTSDRVENNSNGASGMYFNIRLELGTCS
jgi:hypothetical protein